MVGLLAAALRPAGPPRRLPRARATHADPRTHGGTVMTDAGTPQDAQGGPDPGQPEPAPQDATPITPGGPWQTGRRVEQLAIWMQALRSRLHRRGAANGPRSPAGSRAEEVQQARALADARQRQREAMGPVRSRASRIVLAAYGARSGSSSRSRILAASTSYGSGPILQGVLTVSLLLGLLVVAGWSCGPCTRIRRASAGAPRRSSSSCRSSCSLGISGLCLPFVRIERWPADARPPPVPARSGWS